MLFGSVLVYIHNNKGNISMRALYCFQTTASQSSLFDHLINIWEFNPGPIPGTCDLHFFVDFKFQSPLYRQVISSLLF
jgi:coenzyme Q-binding protein COQ10